LNEYRDLEGVKRYGLQGVDLTGLLRDRRCGTVDPGASVEARTGSLDAEFEAAAKKYEVPKELLLAMGYVNTRWEMPAPEVSDYEEAEPGEGAPEARGSYGIMQLVQNPSEDTLARQPR
jgi:hypothetical protein